MERNLSFDYKQLKEIEINLSWPQLEIFPNEANDVHVIIAGDNKTVPQIKVELQGDKLTVEQPKYGMNLNIAEGSWMQILMYIPNDFKGEIEASTIIGGINIKGFEGEEIAADTVSGNIKLDNIKVNQLKAKNISGGITIRNITCNKLKIRTVSGDVVADNLIAKDIKLSGVSGKQRLELIKNFEDIEIVSVTGDVEIIQPSEHVKAKLKAIHGQLLLDNVSDGDGPELSATSVTGDVKIKRNIVKGE